MPTRLILPSEAAYIRNELGSSDPYRQKVILQHLCSRFAGGYALGTDSYAIQLTIGGLILANMDRKVVRWSLNALSLFGDKSFTATAAMQALSAHPADPEILSSALSALARSDRKKFEEVGASPNYAPELIVLSALRNLPSGAVNLRGIKINIEQADAETLKLALLTVGLDRAPPNLFDPRHSNSAIVKALGAHHDPIVSQYSVWAIAENKTLGVADLGISTSRIDAYPANVRGWTYRLFGKAASGSASHHEMIVRGSQDSDAEARSGLARGLLETYYDGLEEVTTRWYIDENDFETKKQILDHIARQGHRVPAYEALAVDIYISEPSNYALRERMEASAAGTELFSKLKRIAIDEQGGGLLAIMGGVHMVKPTFGSVNINNAGAVSLGGTATNYGGNSTYIARENVEKASAVLDDAQKLLSNLEVDERIKTSTLSAIETAKTEPTKANIGAVASGLQAVESALGAVAASGDHLVKIGGYIALLLTLLN